MAHAQHKFLVVKTMTLFGHSAPKPISSGSLWQEGAVGASRVLEKYMSQEEQLLHLSDLYQTSHTDYDRNGANTQLLITESVNDAGSSAPNPTDVTIEGSLEGTTFLWRSIGNKLYLWDNADKSHTRNCTMIPCDQAITAVGISHVIPSSTLVPSSCKYWLVVSSISTVSLFYFNPDTVSPETPPVLSGYVAPTGDTIICSISRPNKFGRIFLGGTDGSVFEFIQHPLSTVSMVSGFLGQTHRRCYLSIITKPWGAWLGPIRSLIGLGKVSGHNRVLAITVDPCRSIIYVLKKSGVEIYHLNTLALQTELSSYTIEQSLQSAQRSGGIEVVSHDPLVDIIPSNPHIGGDILFVLVTRSGARVFVKRTASGGFWGSTQKITCKFCQPSQLTSTQLSSVSIACVKLPERHPHLNIISAYSFNGGRCIFMVSSSKNGSGIVVVRPDESAILTRQENHSTTNTSPNVRERYDYVPLGPVDVRFSALIAPSRVPVSLDCLAPSDGLYSIASDDLRLNGNGYELVVITSDCRQIVVNVPKISEISVDFLSSIVGTNLSAARDLSMQLGPDQFAAQLFSILIDTVSSNAGAATSSSPPGFFVGGLGSENSPNRMQISPQLIERILFDLETAKGLGLVDSGGNMGRRWPENNSLGSAIGGGGPLGSVVHASTQNISARTRGLGLYLSRLLRPIWLAKAFKLEYSSSSSVMTIKPILNSTQRTYMCLLLRPFVEMITTYRQQLVAGTSQYENKMVEGMMVLGSAILECMELLRLFETGQLTPQIFEVSNIPMDEHFANLDTLCVRDIVLSVGVGHEFLMEFVAMLPDSGNILRKHCPLLIPRI